MSLRHLIAIATIAVAVAAPVHAPAKPFVPEGDGTVLERLPERADPMLAELKRLRAAAAASPNDVSAALRLARRAVEAARTSGDPRFLGHAQAALSRWWTVDDVPTAVIVMRATIKQSRHDFAGALGDLDRALARQANDAQARLTRASVLTVLGRYAEAERDCDRLARIAPALVVAACSAGPASLSGRAERAYRSLVDELARSADAEPGVRAWASTLAAEIAARRGDAPGAERHFRGALAIDPRDTYAKAAYADLLLDAKRPHEVIALLREDTANDPLLLRLAIAEMQSGADAAAAHRVDLAQRFDAARRRGDALHAREEARFRLAFDRDARTALALARENWAVQREPADLRVLIDAALAANDAPALAIAREWIAATGLADATLATRMRTSP